MLVAFRCRGCDTKLETESTAMGTEIKCPKCGSGVLVPKAGLEPGVTVGGFKIVKYLESGGMGDVWIARQKSLDRSVALKILSPALAVQADFTRRFLAEARHLATLKHPNIVTIYEAGEDAGILYMAMELVEGETLAKKLASGPMSASQALAMAGKLVSALQYAWSEFQILHRDVKPSNILIDSRGEPTLADFGVAKVVTQKAESSIGSLIGTINYMSPEQMEAAEDIDCRADIYSLGMTLHHAVTGRIPYEDASWVDIVRQQATAPVPDPRTIVPKLQPACAKLICTMVERKREDRYQDWGSLAADMRRVIAGKFPATRPKTSAGSTGAVKPGKPPAPQAEPRRQTPLIVAASAVAGAVIAGGAVMLVVSRGKPDENTRQPVRGPVAAYGNRASQSEKQASNNVPPIAASVSETSQGQMQPTNTIVGGSGTEWVRAPEAPPELVGATWNSLDGDLKFLVSQVERFPQRYRENAKVAQVLFDNVANRSASNAKETELKRKLHAETGRILAKNKDDWDKAVEHGKDGIARQAEASFAARDYAGAEAAYEKTASLFDVDITSWRDAQLKELRQKKDAYVQLTALQAAAGVALAALNPAEATKQVAIARSAPALSGMPGEVAAFAGFVSRVVNFEAQILASLAADKGKLVSIEMNAAMGGAMNGYVKKADATGIEINWVFGGKETSKRHAMGDLAVGEKLRRLTGDGPESCCMRATILLQSRDAARAKGCFTKSTLENPVASNMWAAIKTR